MGLFSLFRGSKPSDSSSENIYDVEVRGVFRDGGPVQERKVKGVYIDWDTHHEVTSRPRDAEAEAFARRFFPSMVEFHYLDLHKS